MTKTRLVAVSASVWAACGAALIFASDEIALGVGADAASALPISLWGSALFGFGIMNWVARHSPLGGIYGRSVVTGNQAHAFIGALLLLTAVWETGAPVPFTVAVLLGVYLVQALFFSCLMFFSSGLKSP